MHTIPFSWAGAMTWPLAPQSSHLAENAKSLSETQRQITTSAADVEGGPALECSTPFHRGALPGTVQAEAQHIIELQALTKGFLSVRQECNCPTV